MLGYVLGYAFVIHMMTVTSLSKFVWRSHDCISSHPMNQILIIKIDIYPSK